MPREYSVNWNRAGVQRNVNSAIRLGIDRTLAQCIAPAKSRTPVKTGTLQGSIVASPSKQVGKKIVGVWGSFDVNYAEVVERGRDEPPKRRGKFMMTNAARKVYPNLPKNIRRFLK